MGEAYAGDLDGALLRLRGERSPGAGCPSSGTFAAIGGSSGRFGSSRGSLGLLAHHLAGLLSSRSPWNVGWRRLPSRVHSVKATSATSSGFTQWLRRASAPRGGFLKAGFSISSLSSRLRRSRRVRSLKPVPTLPAKTSRPPVVDGEQQSAEPTAGAFGIGEAHDDELLPLEALHLEPVLAAAGVVGEVGALGDDPFQAEAAGLAEKPSPSPSTWSL